MPAGRGWRGAAAMVRAGSEALLPHCALSRWQALRSFKLSVTVDPKYHPKIIGRKGAVITQIRLEHDVNIQFPDKDDGSQVGAGGLPCCGPASALLGGSQFLLLSSARMFVAVLGSLALRRVLWVVVFCPVLRVRASSWRFLSPPFCFESPLPLLVFSGLASQRLLRVGCQPRRLRLLSRPQSPAGGPSLRPGHPVSARLCPCPQPVVATVLGEVGVLPACWATGFPIRHSVRAWPSARREQLLLVARAPGACGQVSLGCLLLTGSSLSPRTKSPSQATRRTRRLPGTPS